MPRLLDGQALKLAAAYLAVSLTLKEQGVIEGLGMLALGR